MHRMTKSVNAEGGVTTYGYNIRGNQNKLNDALGYTWNYQYGLVDQLIASVDPEGKVTEFTYNLVGEIEAVTKPGERVRLPTRMTETTRTMPETVTPL